MPTVKWDDLFENAGNVDDTPPPPNTYLCVIEDASWAKTQKGKDMLKFRARIVSGPQKSKAFFGNVTISPENPMALQIGLRHLGVLGLDQGALSSMTDTEQTESVVGNEVMIDSDVRVYKGEERAEVLDIKPSGPAAKPSAAAPKASDNVPPPKASSNMPPPPFDGNEEEPF